MLKVIEMMFIVAEEGAPKLGEEPGDSDSPKISRRGLRPRKTRTKPKGSYERKKPPNRPTS
jgi:hypothetical protein